MIGYFDPDSLQINETNASITFINATDNTDTHEVSITTSKDAKRVIRALKDQTQHGFAGLNGIFKKARGILTMLPGNNEFKDGIITDPDSRKEIPVRMNFNTKTDELPNRSICIAVGEVMEGALMVDRMTIAPIAPIPAPQPIQPNE